MADVHSPQTRSYNMSMIRGEKTTLEVIVRKHLFSLGFRYRKNDKRLPGKPDIVLPKYRTVIFINGCFWHKHEGCKYFAWPKSNVDFWRKKIEDNVKRDIKNYSELIERGWSVKVIWECQLKKEKFNNTMQQLVFELRKHANKC